MISRERFTDVLGRKSDFYWILEDNGALCPWKSNVFCALRNKGNQPLQMIPFFWKNISDRRPTN
jgi:hypothetical protein